MHRHEGWYNIRMDKFTEKTLGCERKYTVRRVRKVGCDSCRDETKEER